MAHTDPLDAVKNKLVYLQLTIILLGDIDCIVQQIGK